MRTCRQASPRATGCSSGSILTCGECRWCTEGFQNLCEHHLLYGYDPFPGAYADYAAVPPIATKNLIPLPHDLPSDLATVADPFACALNGIEQLDIQLGDTVMILGHRSDRVLAGRDGARSRREPRVDDRRQSATGSISRSGVVGKFIDDAWVAGDDNGVEEVLSRTDGIGVERVSVAAPAKPAQQAALEMAAKRAKVVYFAGLPKHDPVSPLDMNQLHYKELAILGAYGASHRQYRITMDYLEPPARGPAGRRDAPVPARADRRGVRDDPVGRRPEDGDHPVSGAVRHRLRRRQPGDERRALRRRRHAGGVRVRGVRPFVPVPDLGRAGPRPLGRARSSGRWLGSSPRCRRARRRSRGCRSARSWTGWSSATPPDVRCVPR